MSDLYFRSLQPATYSTTITIGYPIRLIDFIDTGNAINRTQLNTELNTTTFSTTIGQIRAKYMNDLILVDNQIRTKLVNSWSTGGQTADIISGLTPQNGLINKIPKVNVISKSDFVNNNLGIRSKLDDTRSKIITGVTSANHVITHGDNIGLLPGGVSANVVIDFGYITHPWLYNALVNQIESLEIVVSTNWQAGGVGFQLQTSFPFSFNPASPANFTTNSYFNYTNSFGSSGATAWKISLFDVTKYYVHFQITYHYEFHGTPGVPVEIADFDFSTFTLGFSRFSPI